MNYKIGIVGNGFVGNAIYQNIKDKFDTRVYDKVDSRRLDEMNEILDCDYIFVCLPTPMKENAECDLSIIKEFFYSIPQDSQSIFIVKSTVPIGTTLGISQDRKDLKIVHSPEFLTAKNSVIDFINPDRNIIGGPKDISRKVGYLYDLIFNRKVPTIFTTSNESETIKYFANSFLATKVIFFNLAYELSQKMAMDYETISEGVCSDNRIGYSHSKVPGPDEEFGFGGACFPKDLNALIYTLEEKGINSGIFKEIWNHNVSIRKKRDW